MMERPGFTPISAQVRGKATVLTDADGDTLPINWPNTDGAQFVAAAMNNECRMARRAGE